MMKFALVLVEPWHDINALRSVVVSSFRRFVVPSPLPAAPGRRESLTIARELYFSWFCDATVNVLWMLAQ
jgi:hypothetical protein